MSISPHIWHVFRRLHGLFFFRLCRVFMRIVLGHWGYGKNAVFEMECLFHHTLAHFQTSSWRFFFANAVSSCVVLEHWGYGKNALFAMECRFHHTFGTFSDDVITPHPDPTPTPGCDLGDRRAGKSTFRSVYSGRSKLRRASLPKQSSGPNCYYSWASLF